MRIKTNCSLDLGPSGSSAYWLTKAFHDLGHEIVTGYEADLVMNIDGMPHIERIIGVPYFFWDCDSFMHGPSETEYDQVFIGGSPEDLVKYPEGTVYLPHAFDEDIHKPHDVEKDFDVVMIGNKYPPLYKERNDLVNVLREAGFSVLHEELPPGEEYAKAMSRGKLILNKTLGEKNIPIRFFEGMAIGVLFENYNDNLDALATAHKHYVPYSDTADLVKKVGIYLNNKHLRNRVTQQARKHALKHHTYKHRALEILKYV